MGFGCGSGAGGDGRYPGVSGEGVADGGEDLVPVLGGGGCVAADGVPVAGGFFRAKPAADLLLGFRGTQVTFGLVGGGRDGGVGEEPQYVGFAVAQAFQQGQRGGLLDVLAGHAADFGQAGEDAVAEQLQVLGDGVFRDDAQAVVAGEVGLVDEGAQLAGDLGGPDRVRVGLGGILDVPEQVGCAELVADAREVVVVDIPVVDDHGAVQVAVDEVLERGQVPVAQEVIGEQVRARDLQVPLLPPRPRAGAQRGLVSADDAGEDDQRPDRLV